MAHEISMVNGIGEAAFAMRPAWHGLGTVLTEVPDSRTMITAAHLDWGVATKRLVTEDGVDVPDTVATVRTDTGAVLGCVGTSYRLVQNSEAFAFLDSLVSEGGLKYEAAGALQGGRRVWVLGRMPSFDDIAEGDRSLRYVLFSTSHDGSAALQAIPTSVRVVCANTLRAATARSVGIRHSGDMESKLYQARLLLSQFDSQFTLFRDQARLLATRQLQGDAVEDYLRTLFPEPKREQVRAFNAWTRQMYSIKCNLWNPRQSLPAVRGTWWSLVNAVTEWIDHEVNNTPYQRTEKAKELRFMSRTNGPDADLKSRAFETAIKLSV